MTKTVLPQCCFLLIFLICVVVGDLKHRQVTDKSSTSLQLPPCEACAVVYNSFMDAMKRTGQNHFGGGDTSWEEAKLGPYATSEVRLIEIQELLCSSNRAQDQCLTLVEEWEQYIEDWWFKYRTETPDLYEYLCINSLQLCCPSGHYGLHCKPCPGFPNNICNNKGKCTGNGTRSGTGKCVCDKGYEGELCENCAIDFFKVYADYKFTCKQCDISCQGGCSSSGPENCNNCAKGWTMQKVSGCVDVDECNVHTTSSPCKEGEFCINTLGSFKCKECDNACNGCSGPGPENCIKCSSDYIQEGSLCTKFDTVKSYIIYRYVTYLGLCVGSFIFFKKRPLLGSVVGLSIALSVTITEYIHGNILTNQNQMLAVLNSIKRW